MAAGARAQANQAALKPASRPRWMEPQQWWLWLQGLVGARYDGLAHFGVVAPGVLLRSGQPRVADLDTIRRKHGLGTIVCARGGTRHPLRGRWFRKERAWCESNSVGFVHLPFSDERMPPEDVFERFLRVFDEAGGPVLVHCEQGFHRTGVLCAAYRIAREGWPLQRALDEMDQLGFESYKPKRQPLIEALSSWASARTK